MELRPGYRRTEVGIIPEDWALADILSLSRQIMDFRGRTPKKLGMDWGGGDIRALSAGNVKNGFIDFSEECYFGSATLYKKWMTRGDVAKGDILFTTEAPLGNVALIPDDQKYFLSQRTILLQINPQRASNEFLFQMLLSDLFQRTLADYSSGSTAKGIQRKQFERLCVALPPLSEQRAIAAALSDVDSLLKGLTWLIAKKRHLKQAAMQQLLTGQTRLPGFSAEWEVRSLTALASIVQGQVDPRVAPYRSMILVGPEHVESGSGKLLARRAAVEQGAISGKYLFRKGDVVYGKINPYLKKAFLADFDGLCSADMYALRPLPDVCSGFLLAVILGDEFSRYSESVSVRSGMPKINRDEMAGFSTIVPGSVTEQSAIADILFDMDAELAGLEARLDKTRALKQAMMQQLLTGRMRLV